VSKIGLKLNRAQLAKIAGNDPQAIRAFEELFREVRNTSTVSGTGSPTTGGNGGSGTPVATVKVDTDGIQMGADLGSSMANVAASALEELKNQAGMDLDSSMASVAASALEELKNQIVQDVLTALSSLMQPVEVYTPPSPESDGKFQKLTNGDTVLLRTSKNLTNGAASATATLTNAPTAGNPTKWVAINDNGTTRLIPTW
jgi:hypothetical protein